MKISSILRKGTTVVLFSFFVTLCPVIAAQSSSTIAQSFKTDSSEDFVNGALVSSKDGDTTVELATPQTAHRLLGVVDSSSLVNLSEGGKEVAVALNGTTAVLVSDINGDITSGDKIAVSPVAGVGMRASTDSQIVGTAQADFQPTTTRTITDRSGKRHDIKLGYVTTQIGVAVYQVSESAFLPPFMQNIANSIAGRPVALARVLICSVILILGFITVVVLVFTATRSAMTSLGRNPLAAHAIRRGLYQTVTISLVIVGCAIVASYLILTV